MNGGNITILYAATYYVDRYVRQEVLIDALRSLPHVTLKLCVVNSSSRWRYVRFFWQYWRALRQGCDIVILGWRGVEIFPIVHWMTKPPIIYDAFLSVHETLCLDRKKFAPDSLVGRIAQWLDQTAVRQSSVVFCDTDTDAEYFSQTFNLPPEKVKTVYVGVDKKLYNASPPASSTRAGVTVLFYGTFLPLHGAELIVAAANEFRHDRRIRFQMIGDGPTYRASKQTARPESQIEWIGRVGQEQLAKHIAAADICLGGPFADLPKAYRVITTKTYQFLAMGKASIISDTPANRELFTHQRDCVMVPPGDAAALSEAIRTLVDHPDLRTRVSEKAQQTANGIENMIADQVRVVISHYAQTT